MPTESPGGSSAATSGLAGATSQGGNYNFGTAYGPGGLVLTDQRGSIGASAGVNSSLLIPMLIAGAIAAVIFLFPRRKK